MQKLEFAEALDQIATHDPRFARDAYYFVRDALDFTIKQRRKTKDAPPQRAHVSGQQLLEGIRLFALKQFGPMVTTVFEYWGVKRCEDFGDMVFHLVKIGIFGRTERDSMEDFKSAYTFHEAFILPFLPAPPVPHRRLTLDQPAQELS